MVQEIGNRIAEKRKEQGLTQKKLAEQLNVTFQAVSKWEKGISTPDISLLPLIAFHLHTSVDALLGYPHVSQTKYEERYKGEAYYWGVEPNHTCYEIMKLKPPVKAYRVLDIGCGEGKDAVFFAKCGYRVSAFDLAESGLEKARDLARLNQVEIDFFQADMNTYEPEGMFDIIFSSGSMHYIPAKKRKQFMENLKKHTAENGIHAIKLFVQKPFVEPAPDREEAEMKVEPWYSGELMGYYKDWLIHWTDEFIYDCTQGAAVFFPHKHCMNVVIAQKYKG